MPKKATKKKVAAKPAARKKTAKAAAPKKKAAAKKPARKKVSPLPAGFHTLSPHIVVKGAAQAIEFYKKAFGAKEMARMPGPGGKLMHAELCIGDSPLMLCDELPEMGGSYSPLHYSGTAVTLTLYVPDVDQVYQRSLAAGAQSVMPPADMFWGDRYCKVKDPFGHEWAIATHIEDLSHAQVMERAAAFMGG